ncbi:hypothetical protein [Occultella kanbiaonis]|uniref:hypothetical protein n=1 Tax=Occultella kanbiaonis TaxID=2675754 RepID=UPI0012B79DD8|nr:hypothetical protein [Occultella kanbiaonis]
MLDFTDYVADLRALVDEHHLGEGRYARWSTRCGGAEPAVNPYGCADAVNILYTLGELPSSEAARREHMAALRDLQDPDSGSFDEPTHRREHTTAHVVAALELFDARPAHRLHFLEPLLDRDALERYLDALDWSRPWPASHGGAGVAAALFLTGRVSHTWLSWYFDWLDAHVDPGTGLWRRA